MEKSKFYFVNLDEDMICKGDERLPDKDSPMVKHTKGSKVIMKGDRIQRMLDRNKKAGEGKPTPFRFTVEETPVKESDKVQSSAESTDESEKEDPKKKKSSETASAGTSGNGS